MISKGGKIKTFRFKSNLFIIVQQKVLNCSCSVVYCSTTVLLSRQQLVTGVGIVFQYPLGSAKALHRTNITNQLIFFLWFFWPGSCSVFKYWVLANSVSNLILFFTQMLNKYVSDTLQSQLQTTKTETPYFSRLTCSKY